MRVLVPLIVWVLVLVVRVLMLTVWIHLLVTGGVGVGTGIRKRIARRTNRTAGPGASEVR
jgi:hypothetical protein